MGARFATVSTVLAGVTDADGVIAAPRHLRAAQAQLDAAQRWLARTEKGSRRRAKAVRRVQRLHGKVTARREGFHRTLAIALVEAHPVIGIEDLNIKGMARRTRGWRFSKLIADNGWANFVTTLEHQARKRGSMVVKADRFYPSSKTCSDCGAVKAKLPLSDREYECTTCGLVSDRDVNAAVNLSAVARHALETREQQQYDGVSDAGEASSRQTPVRHGAAAFGTSGSVERRVPDPDLALAG
jgi:putative transposase